MNSLENTESVETGQKPTNINCIYEDGQWWYVGTGDGARRSVEAHNKKNKCRMFVGGKYVPKSHPLYKAGRYKTFEEAAFSSLQNYEKSSKGDVYLITNPAWPGWIKVGMAVDANDRCDAYQTSSPHRDYTVMHSFKTEDRRRSELEAHGLIEQHAVERKGEWFKIKPKKAIALLNTIH